MTNLFPDRPALGMAPTIQATEASRKEYKKAAPPQLGEAFGPRWDWDQRYTRLPGGSIVQFNLDKLTLEDYRQMKDHYQINASLSVLTFMMHQMDWKIESDSPKVAAYCQANMMKIWTRMVRALSQAFWAGYSPCILQWENDMQLKGVQLTKIKDLRPDLCDVHWEFVEGWAPPGHVPPKLPVYGGIKQFGVSWPIPPENTLWYTLLKENENFYGKKLLRPAFTPWYFSVLNHLFANHYFERFGEPIPVGRAPYETVKNADGTITTGAARMGGILQNLRNRGVVVLPDDRSQMGNEVVYDYNIEYLESQMRGADFERYLMRLDEEISLSLFTPLLILRTADVGSYNLGTGHWNVYQQMLNAIAGDWAEYIDRYILAPLVNFNFGPNAKRAHITFRKLGDDRLQVAITMLQAIIASGKAMPDLQELGEIAGLTVEEVEEVTRDDTDPGTDDPSNPDPGGSGSSGESTQAGRRAAQAIITKMASRACAQYRTARREGKESFTPDFGHQRQLEVALGGVPQDALSGKLAVASGWMSEMYGAGMDGPASNVENVLSDLIFRVA